MKVKKEYPAKYIETYTEYKNHYPIKHHIYEYKGYQYEVIDAGWIGGQNPLYEQHRAEQDHIDELIEKEKKLNSYKGENAEVGFNVFWDYVNGDGEDM